MTADFIQINSHCMHPYLRLMRFDKPVGILLLFWPTAWALILTHSTIKNWVIFTLGVIVMRSGGCVINDIADKDFDGHVERTRSRVLPNHEVSVQTAYGIFLGLMLLALLLVLQTNLSTIVLAGVGLLLTVLYPFSKRFFSGPQLILGLAFSWSVPMVYAANVHPFDSQAGFLFIAAILWPVIYDTMYAMVDRADDLKIGIRSTAIFLGRFDKLVILWLQAVFLSIWFVMANLHSMQLGFYLMIMPTSLLIGYQCYLLYQDTTEHYFKAFKLSQWIGCLLFIALVLGI